MEIFITDKFVQPIISSSHCYFRLAFLTLNELETCF